MILPEKPVPTFPDHALDEKCLLVIIVGSRPRDAAARRRLLLRAVVGLEHRTAGIRELLRVLLQARHDSVLIRNPVAAEPEDIGRTGHLLLEGSAVLLRGGRRGNGDDHRKTKDHPVCLHGRLLTSD
jgi:hypothetical protein